MVRKNFFITETQNEWIIETAQKDNLSEVELVRRIFEYIANREDIIDEIMYRRVQDES